MRSFLKYVETTRIPPRSRYLLEELTTNRNVLTATDVYDFYWLYSAFSYDQINIQDYNVAEFYLKELRDIYLQAFTELLTKQIEKYVSRGRIDMVQGKPAFDIATVRAAPFQQRPMMLRKMMAQTYRSDMTRRNDVWDMIAEYLQGLSHAENAKQITWYIDRINNSVHNTGTAVLDKFKGGMDLLRAFDTVHRAKVPRDYARFVSPEVRRLVKVWEGPGLR